MNKFIVAMGLLLAACSPGAERQHGYDAVMPPELADCKVFAISDGSKTLYVTRCGFDTTTSWSQSCGKGCIMHYDSAVTEVVSE